MIEEYLRELRASLRTRPQETERIIAEAQDHLAQSVAAGLAAGLTEIEAQEAALSAFGSVSVVVRAHTTQRVRLRAIAADLPMAAWKLAWLWLLGSGAMHLFAAFVLRPIVAVRTMSGGELRLQPMPEGVVFEAGSMFLLGLGLAAGYYLARTGRPAPLGGFFPLAAAVFFIVAIPVTVVVGAPPNGAVGLQGGLSVLALAVLAVLYSARMAGMLIWQRRTS